jgi:5'-AMP-activated protein kinase regulatory gamma subunit
MDDSQYYYDAREYVVGTKIQEKKHLAEKGEVPNIIKNAKDFLSDMKVADLLPEHIRLVTASVDEPVCSVLKKLIDNKILSVPLYDPRKGRYNAYIDMLDILYHALDVFDKDITQPHTYSALLKIKEFADVPCGKIANLSKRNPFRIIDENANLYVCLELMVKWKVHRVAIMDKSGELLNSVSQSHIVRSLCKIITRFPVMRKTVGDLKLGYKEHIVSVTPDMKVKDAFKVIRSKGISGVPVLSPTTGKVIATISVSDLKQIGYDGSFFDKLDLTVEEWLQQYPQAPVVYYVTPHTTVSEVALNFKEKKVHRLFVLDLTDKLIGLIALYDFLEAIYNSL